MVEISQDYRPLTPLEREILHLLFRKDFPGKKELIEQIENIQVKVIDENHSLSFLVSSNSRASIKRGIPTEARMKDEDGIFINVLLHVVDGKLNELEIYKDDGSQIRKKVDPAVLEIVEF